MSWVSTAAIVARGPRGPVVRPSQARAAVMAHRIMGRPQGDPGLLSVLGKGLSFIGKTALGVATGGLAGGVTAVLGQVLGSRKTGASGAASAPLPMSVGTPTLLPAPVMPGGAPVLVPDSTVTRGGLTISGPWGTGIQAGGTTTVYGGGPGPQAAGKSCGNGYHYNKSAYHTRGGFVEAGTACVKNRRRNPLNPRALSRAMSRVTSARKAINSIVSFERVVTPKGRIRVRRPKKRCG